MTSKVKFFVFLIGIFFVVPSTVAVLSASRILDRMDEAKEKELFRNSQTEHLKEVLRARDSDSSGYGLASHPDDELGSPYRVYPIGGDKFFASLIEYPFGSSPRAVAQASFPRGILLYVHGYNDYFFQRELAEKADSAGYAFWAIDLHYAGRSLRPGEPRGDFRDVSEFYGELNSAYVTAYRIVQVNVKRKVEANLELDGSLDTTAARARAVASLNVPSPMPFVIIGHSFGGLIASLFANRNDIVPVDALVLNSPFLELNFGALARHTALPLLAFLGEYFPDYPIPGTGNPNYAYSLHKDHMGEWSYNTNIKGFKRPRQNLGWIHGIYEAHNRIKAGLQIKSPILVMHGDCSIKGSEWVDEYTRCDGVLDVDQMEELAPNLGSNVTTKTIKGGLHDLYLSKKPVRDEAYKATFEFIDQALQGKLAK